MSVSFSLIDPLFWSSGRYEPVCPIFYTDMEQKDCSLEN